MANEYQYWSGKVTWCNVDRVDNFGRYSICFYPDTKAYNEIMKLKQEGLMNQVKKDDDGYFINISRPTEFIQKTTGKHVSIPAPLLLDKDGKTPMSGTAVGKGSDVTVKVEIRQYKTPQKRDAVAVRLESVRVDNLIPFEPARDFPPVQAKQAEGMATAPKGEHPF